MASDSIPQTTAPGFASEAELVNTLVRHLPTLLAERAHHHLVRLELGIGRAIADVVAVLSTTPLDAGMPPLSVKDSVVLAALRRNGPTRVDLLEARCGLRRLELRDGVLARLSEFGLIHLGGGGRVALATEWATSITILAIEAKLRAWKGALAQARSYLRYADEAYVALPDPVASQLAASNEFGDHGVGLLAVNSHVQVVRQAVHSPRDHDWRREYAASRLLAHGTH